MSQTKFVMTASDDAPYYDGPETFVVSVFGDKRLADETAKLLNEYVSDLWSNAVIEAQKHNEKHEYSKLREAYQTPSGKKLFERYKTYNVLNGRKKASIIRRLTFRIQEIPYDEF